MLTVGDRFPEFALKATVSTSLSDAFTEVRNDSYPGKWIVAFFWPKDFTFVCPTEIAEFGRQNAVQLLLGSGASRRLINRQRLRPTELAERNNHPAIVELLR